ncbi:MAG: hypothetical protein ACR2MO_13410 [Acidimicrobiales bacterium]
MLCGLGSWLRDDAESVPEWQIGLAGGASLAAIMLVMGLIEAARGPKL